MCFCDNQYAMLPSQCLQADSIPFWGTIYLQLLFLNNNTPFMLFLAVHDVLEPILDHSSVIAAISTDHWHLKIFAPIVNDRNRGDEILFLVSCQTKNDCGR